MQWRRNKQKCKETKPTGESREKRLQFGEVDSLTQFFEPIINIRDSHQNDDLVILLGFGISIFEEARDTQTLDPKLVTFVRASVQLLKTREKCCTHHVYWRNYAIQKS